MITAAAMPIGGDVTSLREKIAKVLFQPKSTPPESQPDQPHETQTPPTDLTSLKSKLEKSLFHAPLPPTTAYSLPPVHDNVRQKQQAPVDVPHPNIPPPPPPPLSSPAVIPAPHFQLAPPDTDRSLQKSDISNPIPIPKVSQPRPHVTPPAPPPQPLPVVINKIPETRPLISPPKPPTTNNETSNSRPFVEPPQRILETPQSQQPTDQPIVIPKPSKLPQIEPRDKIPPSSLPIKSQPQFSIPLPQLPQSVVNAPVISTHVDAPYPTNVPAIVPHTDAPYPTNMPVIVPHTDPPYPTIMPVIVSHTDTPYPTNMPVIAHHTDTPYHTDNLPEVSEKVLPPPKFPVGVVSHTNLLDNAISLEKAHNITPPFGTTEDSVRLRKSKIKPKKVKKKKEKRTDKEHLPAVKGNPNSLFNRLFCSGRGDEPCIKAIFGVICGLILGAVLFVLLAFSFKYSYDKAAWITIAFTIILILGLVFSSYFRCMILMALPNLFSGRGRAALMTVIIAVILAGPLVNITHNFGEVSSSLACITEIAKNASEELKNQLLEPFRQIYLQVQETVDKLKSALAVIEAALQPVFDVLTTLQNGFESAIQALQNITIVSLQFI